MESKPDTLLTAVAALEAYAARDWPRVQVLLNDPRDAAVVNDQVWHICLAMLGRLYGNPQSGLDLLRVAALRHEAAALEVEPGLDPDPAAEGEQ
jgi:hypothetical protein